MKVIELIEAQQKGQENTDIWMVGEQLKEICTDPECAALVEQDIQAIPLKTAAGKIKAWADEQHRKKKGNCICVPPNVAEGIIRECYGLPAAKMQQMAVPAAIPQQEDILDLDAFL